MTRVRIHWPGNITMARAMSQDVLDHFNLPRGLTVNGITTLDVDDDTLEGLRELAASGTIRLEEAG